MGKNQHVTSSPKNKWQVIGEGNSKATKIFNNKADAIDYGKNIAKNQKSELFIHGLNGKIQNRNSYGNDPCPPKDKKH